jgi:hypothetical protein
VLQYHSRKDIRAWSFKLECCVLASACPAVRSFGVKSALLRLSLVPVMSSVGQQLALITREHLLKRSSCASRCALFRTHRHFVIACSVRREASHCENKQFTSGIISCDLFLDENRDERGVREEYFSSEIQFYYKSET